MSDTHSVSFQVSACRARLHRLLCEAERPVRAVRVILSSKEPSSRSMSNSGKNRKERVPEVPDLILDQIRFRLESGQDPEEIADVVVRAERLPREQVIDAIVHESRRIQRQKRRLAAVPRETPARPSEPDGNLGIGIVIGFIGGIFGVGAIYATDTGKQTREGAWVGFCAQAVMAFVIYLLGRTT